MRSLMIGVFGVLLSASSAWPCNVAGNLVTNCGFDTDLTSWTSEIANPACAHNAADGSSAVGNSECGAAADGGFLVQLSNTACIDVAPSTSYGLGGDFRLFSGGTVNCLVQADASTDNSCTAPAGFTHNSPGINPTTGSYTQASGFITTGASHESVRIRIVCSSSEDFVIRIDDVFFGLGLTPVKLQEFSVE
jgi:hypothetical protein